MAQSAKKRKPSPQWVHKQWPPGTLRFYWNLGHNHPAPLSAKTRLTSALRLHPTSKKSPTQLRLPYAERTTKSSSSTRKSAGQVKWVSCTAGRSTPSFESSPSKCEHLLGSLSPLTFKVARFRDIKPTYLTHCQQRSGNPRRLGCRRCL